MRGSRLLFMASWIILLVLAIGVTLVSLGSAWIGLRGAQDNITPTYTLEQIRSAGGEEVANAIRGRRVTAATWALGYALLMFWVVLIPYRRGERWAWWALLISLGLSQLLSLMRVIALGSTFGSGAAATLLAFLLLGLLAGVPRIFSRSEARAEL
jgi:hypothetical protein